MSGINTDGFSPNHSKVLHDTSRINSGLPKNEIQVDVKETSCINSRLPDLSSLKKISQESSLDIRDEAIKKAQSLLDNPNFLSDSKIDSLVGKLIDLEEI